MIDNLVKIIKDERAGGAEALKGLGIIMTLILIMALCIDIFYVINCRSYIKTQMDFSNRAVYKEINFDKLSEGEIYLNKGLGRNVFMKYLKKNLNLDDNLVSRSMRIENVKIKHFIIYNQGDLPVTTPTGDRVNNTTVFTQVEAEIIPIFSGLFSPVKIKPYLTTDLPR